ncbi:hypothetical protein CsNV_083 [Callinectes sapidus nudivirus]|nr:hypothetical protein CsNV_083 [Callinectes sapidus nudivirus]
MNIQGINTQSTSGMSSQPSTSGVYNTSTKIIKRDDTTHMKLLQTIAPVKFMNYLKNHIKDKIIHLCYGSIKCRKWNVVPFEINPKNEEFVSNLEILAMFYFICDVSFVVYNTTKRNLQFGATNIIVIKL